MSSVQPQPESVSRAGRLDQILRELLHQTPGVEAAAVEVLHGPVPLPAPRPANVTRGYLDAHDAVQNEAPSSTQPAESYEAFDEQAYTGYSEPAYAEPAFSEPSYSEPAYSEPSYSEPA